MNFIPLFTSAKVIGAIYRVVLTMWLLYHLIKKMYGREVPRNGRTSFGGRSHRRVGPREDFAD